MQRILQNAFKLSFLVLSTLSLGQSDPQTVKDHFKNEAARYHLLTSDVEYLEIVSEAPSKAPGVKHLYVRQRINGIPVSNGLATVTIKNGKVVYVASRLKSNLSAPSAQPAMSAKSALESVIAQLGIVHADPVFELSFDKNLQQYVFAKGDVSLEDIPVKLVYTVTKENEMMLCWDLSIASKDKQNWYSIRASANDGTIIERSNWISQCSFGECTDENHTHHSNAAVSLLPPPPPGADQYLVYALPVESPNHGNRSLVINPSDPVASPFGWHDANGIPGDEFTITRGNNVYASDDINDDDEPGYAPNGTAALNFSFPYDSAVGVQGNQDAVITNLFYMNNMMHDIWHFYGFDEASGNFQQQNYSGDGLGEDFVFADAQDGSGTNNANFGTPPDGGNPRMQMFLWSQNTISDQLSVNSPSSIAGEYVSSTAGFGGAVPVIPITEDVVLVNDGSGDATDGCQTIVNAAALSGKIALIRRGTCTFGSKVEACEAAGAVAVIVMNNTGGNPISMSGPSSATIPSVMVSQSTGNLFVNTINGGATLNATLVNPGDLTANDSDLDNMIIAHEYGHGISTRLTGGAANSDCLQNAEQMGEGWSDWFGLMITMEPGDLGADRRGVGTYVINQSATGTGIRPAAYSTSFSVNSYTYSATNNSGSISEPHGIGFVWATMLWDLNWALIDQYGFDPDIKTGTGGNNKAMSLVIEALKLQPCSPGFVDGRDAILAADELLYDGANKCLIWKAFAKRGLGYSADQGSSESRSDQTAAFDLPAACLLGLAEKGLELVTIYPNPTKDLLHIDMTNYKQVQSVRIIDLQGKVLFETTDIREASLTVDLSAWKSGIYMVQLTDVNGARSVEIVKH